MMSKNQKACETDKSKLFDKTSPSNIAKQNEISASSFEVGKRNISLENVVSMEESKQTTSIIEKKKREKEENKGKIARINYDRNEEIMNEVSNLIL